MNTPRRPALMLAGLALGTLLALLIAPQTRWLVGAQIAASGLTFQSPQDKKRQEEDAQRRVVAANPNDFAIQLAAASIAGSSREQRVAYLRTLIPRFANQPALYAALLRYEMGSPESRTGIYLRREEDWQIGNQFLSSPEKIPPPPDPALLNAFDADAAAGERLDPENAYFPFMRAIGLFAAHKDDAGLEAMRRAGTKTVWREYIPDEVNARRRLAEAAFGHLPAIRYAEIVAAQLLPQYSGLRGAARVAIVLAANQEQAGQTAQGLSTRLAVLHIGSLMRVQSTYIIGSLVGIAIADIATARPGGAAAVTGDDHAHRQLQAFTAYAQQIGHPEAAREALAEYTAGRTTHDIERKAMDQSVFDVSQFTRLAAWWAGDLLTLVNAFWFLVIGGLAAALSRLPSIRQRQPMSRKTLVVTGLAGGLSLGLLVLLAGTLAGNQIGDGSLFQEIQGMEGSASSQSLAGVIITAAVGMLLPLIVQIGLTIAALVRRIPLSVALVEGFRKASLPAACVLILLYGALLLGTVRQERQMNDGLDQVVQHEGRYLASLVGQTWPG